MARLRKKISPVEKARKKEQTVDADGVASIKKTAETTTGSSKSASSKESGKPSKPIQAAAKAPAEPNAVQKGLQFLREVRVELKKVTWPNRKQTAGSTIVVIILVFIIASFLGLVDIGLSKLVQVVLA